MEDAPSTPTVSGACVSVMQGQQEGLMPFMLSQKIHIILFHRYGRCEQNWPVNTPPRPKTFDPFQTCTESLTCLNIGKIQKSQMKYLYQDDCRHEPCV